MSKIARDPGEDAGAKPTIIVSHAIRHPRRQALIEIALIVAVFAIHGGWPVPDNNEPYYLGKAIHYWNPAWLAGDFFLETADAHTVFYFTFGWLSLWLSPVALAWAGRALCWSLLAWGWRRLSFAAVPRPWWSVLTAAMFVGLMERFHMAGEWVVAGVESKPFAYALVFFGLASILQNRWNRGLLLIGAAGAFHPLVGGWSAVAAGFAWTWLAIRASCETGAAAGLPGSASDSFDGITAGQAGSGTLIKFGVTNARGFPPLRSLWPGILGCVLLALPGVIPTLMLDFDADVETVRQARLLYVFERLPHHLALTGIHREFILRMALLSCFWMLLGVWRRRIEPASADFHRPLDILRGWVWGAIAIALAGAAIHLLIHFDANLAAGLLRFYWFRLLDAALPLGVAIESAAIIHGLFEVKKGTALICAKHPTGRFDKWGLSPFLPRFWLALAIVLAAFHLGDRAIDRVAPDVPRTHKLAGNKDASTRRADFDDWRAACEWIKTSGAISPGAIFLTPRLSHTLLWYAERGEVVAWKNVPQSAEGIVRWWRRVQDVHGTGRPLRCERWHEPLAEAGVDRLKQIADKYGADYLITERTDPPLELPVLYRNHTYIVYKLR